MIPSHDPRYHIGYCCAGFQAKCVVLAELGVEH